MVVDECEWVDESDVVVRVRSVCEDGDLSGVELAALLYFSENA